MLLWSLNTLLGTVLVRSPKKSLRTMLRLYQARGNAKISVNLLISYLNEADPISTMAKKKITIISLLKQNKTIISRQKKKNTY